MKHEEVDGPPKTWVGDFLFFARPFHKLHRNKNGIAQMALLEMLGLKKYIPFLPWHVCGGGGGSNGEVPHRVPARSVWVLSRDDQVTATPKRRSDFFALLRSPQCH